MKTTIAIIGAGPGLGLASACHFGAEDLSSYLSSIVGLLSAFFCLFHVAGVALDGQWISLPSMQVPERPSAARNMLSILSALKSPPIALGMSACAAFFIGQFILLNNIRPFLETVTRVDVATLSLVLLVIGATVLSERR
jgi:predicted MFS family arabinose efflux permease